MRKITMALAFFSCAVLGRYMQVSTQDLDNDPFADRTFKAGDAAASSKWKLLALLLSRLDLADAFHPGGLQGLPSTTIERQTGHGHHVPVTTVQMKESAELTRRNALTAGVLSAMAASLLPQAARAELTLDYIPDIPQTEKERYNTRMLLSPYLCKQNLLLILRVKEAAEQETRLIESGKYKDKLRLDVKRAIAFMLYTYNLQDRFNQASAFAESYERQVQANKIGQKTVDALIGVITYFEDELNALALTEEQQVFVLKTLRQVRKNIDNFLGYMPPIIVRAAEKQLIDENKANAREYPKDEEMINMNKTADMEKVAAPV